LKVGAAKEEERRRDVVAGFTAHGGVALPDYNGSLM
jgi:hypothetical protein